LSDPLDVIEPGEGRIDDQRVQPQRGKLIRAGGVAQHLRVPPEGPETAVQDGEKTAVVIDQRDPDRGRGERR